MLVHKFMIRETEARGLTDFLLCMFKWEPKERWTAAQLLEHYWLKMIPNFNTHMSPDEYNEYNLVISKQAKL